MQQDCHLVVISVTYNPDKVSLIYLGVTTTKHHLFLNKARSLENILRSFSRQKYFRQFFPLVSFESS